MGCRPVPRKLARSYPMGRIGMANGREEYTGPTMSELLVDPATPLVIAVHTGQQVDQWEISMELDEEPEDTHGYQPSGFLNPLTLPEAKGYPSSRFPNLHGMVTHIGIRNPTGFTPGNSQSMCSALPGHQTSIAPPPLQWPWLVTQVYQFLPHLGWLSLSALEQDSTSRGTAVPHPWG